MPSAYRRRNGRQVLELRFDALAGIQVGLEPGLQRGQLAYPLPDCAEAREDSGVAFIQRGIALGTETLHTLGTCEHLTRRRQLLVLEQRSGRDRPERRLFELCQLKGHQLLPRGPVGRQAGETLESLGGGAHGIERSAGWRRERFETAEVVEDRQMRRRVQQGLVFVLAVQLDQPRGQILQRTGGRQVPVDERTAPALGGDLASDQQLLAPAFEDGLDCRAVLPGSDQVAGGATAQEQPDRLHEDRLAGSGFPGEDVQPGVELELD